MKQRHRRRAIARHTKQRWGFTWRLNAHLIVAGKDPAWFWKQLRWDTEHPVRVPQWEYENV